MSWRTINRILGLATTNRVFAEYLLKNPQEALNAYGINLPPGELDILCTCQAHTIQELSQQLIEKIGPNATRKSSDE